MSRNLISFLFVFFFTPWRSSINTRNLTLNLTSTLFRNNKNKKKKSKSQSQSHGQREIKLINNILSKLARPLSLHRKGGKSPRAMKVCCWLKQTQTVLSVMGQEKETSGKGSGKSNCSSWQKWVQIEKMGGFWKMCSKVCASGWKIETASLKVIFFGW